MSISQLITSNLTDFHFDCTRWCSFTLLSHVRVKSHSCWRENYKRWVITALT